SPLRDVYKRQDRPDPGRLAALAARAELLGAPLVTEHIAFVRAGGPLTASPGLEAGHLLPVPRTWDALDVLCENVRIAQDSLPVPLALENIAALITWPDEELTEGQFLAELVERTGVRLLIDVANLHTNHVNLGQDPAKALDELPVEAIAYVHVAGGVEKNGVWHDTHAHPVTAPVLEVLAELRSRVDPPGVLLERDDAFPPARELAGELNAIRATLRKAAPPAGSQAPAGSPAPKVTVPAAPAAPVSEPPNPAPSVSAPPVSDAARDRTAVAQTALLSALVAGTPAPAGFDPARLRVQSRSLAAKRADVVAKVAPELPEILGDGYRAAFLAYAGGRPMSGGYRRDALDFAEHVLIAGGPADPVARRELTYWWQDRSGSRPPGRATRLIRAARAALVGR
uniref:multinuclear nonheme iron-dependent oxidase n=1 Tax=Streptomyces sp. sk226 TaxID=2034268 RepID=UPI000D1C8D88